MSTIPKKSNSVSNENKEMKIMCGVIMPLSPMENYPQEHWPMVQTILFEAITTAGFQPDMVSNSDEVSIVQKNIVQNIYNNEIIVCDISGRNANVMFELGMRLTFDKPTVIVKDDITTTPFDTSVIEYIPYRKDLRYADIQDFKRKLTAKIIATHKMKDNEGYSPFIKHFGDFTVPKLDQKEVGPLDYLLDSFNSLRQEVRSIVMSQNETLYRDHNRPKGSRNNLNTFIESNIGKVDNLYIPLKKFLEVRKDEILNSNIPFQQSVENFATEYYNIVPEASKYPSSVRSWIEEILSGYLIDYIESPYKPK